MFKILETAVVSKQDEDRDLLQTLERVAVAEALLTCRGSASGAASYLGISVRRMNYLLHRHKWTTYVNGSGLGAAVLRFEEAKKRMGVR